MQPIYTQIASGSASSMVFNNIPNYYTDLQIKISARFSGSFTYSDLIFAFDSSASIYSSTMSGNYIQRQANNSYILAGNATGSTATASTFSNIEIYIPNYSSANFKSVIVDSVAESNVSTSSCYYNSGLYRSTSPISIFSIGTAGGGNIVAGSTISLYGITKG